MSFLKATFSTKTGIFGVIAIAAGLVQLLPMFGSSANVELIMLGIAMLTLRHTLYKQDVNKLDLVLDKLLGDKLSGVTQDLLIALLEAKDGATVGEVKASAAEKTKVHEANQVGG